MTDEYIAINKPGQTFGIIEIIPTQFDSTYGYPIEEKELRAYTLVDRDTHTQINNETYRKVYFTKKDDRYCWQIQNDLFLGEYQYSDTIHFRPKTWYRFSTANTTDEKYFYWNGDKGDFVIKSKPKPGPGPW